MKAHKPMLYVALFVLAVCLPSLPGCSSGSGRRNTGFVSGIVTYQGSPLRGGTIHFLVPNQVKVSGWIRGDGTFGLEVPVGTAKVAIETQSVQSMDRDAMLEKWGDEVGPFLVHRKKHPAAEKPARTAPAMVYTPIPEHYSDPDRSGFAVDVERGEQEFDFELVGPAQSASR